MCCHPVATSDRDFGVDLGRALARLTKRARLDGTLRPWGRRVGPSNWPIHRPAECKCEPHVDAFGTGLRSEGVGEARRLCVASGFRSRIASDEGGPLLDGAEDAHRNTNGRDEECSDSATEDQQFWYRPKGKPTRTFHP